MEVYCWNCQFFYKGNEIKCIHSSNIERKEEKTWYEKIITYDYKKHPKELNKRNNCNNYKEITYNEI